MSLLLCRQEPVKHPYYFENLGIHLYSSQELSYVIYNNPLLVMDGFVDDHLIEFIRDELDMGFLALKVERWLKSGENPDEALALILQETDYYNSVELSKFRQQMAALKKMSPAEYGKAKADFLFGKKQYGKAIGVYERVLAEPGGSSRDEAFISRIWNNLAASYARMFLFDKAFHAYQKSYELVKSSEALQKLYYITKFNPALVLKDRYQSIITDEIKAEWDAEYEAAREKAKEADSVKKLDELFQKDSIKRLSGATAMVKAWKQEYRNMI